MRHGGGASTLPPALIPALMPIAVALKQEASSLYDAGAPEMLSQVLVPLGKSLHIELEQADDVLPVAACVLFTAVAAAALAHHLFGEQMPFALATQSPSERLRLKDEDVEADKGLQLLAPHARSPAPSAPISRARIWAMTALNLSYGFTLAVQGIVIQSLEAERLWSESPSLALGAFAALCGVAQLVGPAAGHWSDVWRSRFGRRRPLIVISVAFVCHCFFVLWLTSRLQMRYTNMVYFFLQQVALTVMTSTQLGLVPDRVPEKQRDFAGGASAANIVVGALLGFMVVEATSTWDYHWNYCFMVALTLASAIPLCAATREESSLDLPVAIEVGWLQQLGRSYTFDFRRHRGFGLLMVTKTLYCASVVVKGFLLFFCQDTFRFPDAGMERALTAKVSIMAEATSAVAAISTMLVLDRFAEVVKPSAFSAAGASPCYRMPWNLRVVIFGALWMCFLWFGPLLVGIRVHAEFPDAGLGAAAKYSLPMLCGTSAWGIGQGLYLAGDQALSFALLPDRDHAAQSLGLVCLCSFFGGILGGMTVGSMLAALSTDVLPGQRYTLPGYGAIFTFASLTSLAIAAFAAQIKYHLTIEPSVDS